MKKKRRKVEQQQQQKARETKMKTERRPNTQNRQPRDDTTNWNRLQFIPMFSSNIIFNFFSVLLLWLDIEFPFALCAMCALCLLT